MAAGHTDGTFAVIPLQSEQPRITGQLSQFAITSIAASADRSRIAIGTDAGEVGVFATLNGRILLSSKPCDRPIWGLSFSPDGNHLATGTERGAIQIMQIQQTADLARNFRTTFLELTAIRPSRLEPLPPMVELPTAFAGWTRTALQPNAPVQRKDATGLF